MSRTLATLTGNNRHGTYTVTVHDMNGSGDSGVALDMPGAPLLRWDKLQGRYGVALLGSEISLTADDPTGILDALFGSRFVDTDYRVRITGPDGLGGTLDWEGLPMQSEDEASAAPLVDVTNPVGIAARCGLGKASDVSGTSTFEVSLAAIIARLQLLRPGTVLMGTTAFPLGAPDGLLSRVQLVGEIEDERPGDYGTLEDQLLGVARNLGLMLYQPSRLVSAGYGWHALPRTRIGKAQGVTRFINANSIDAQSLTAQSVTAADWESKDRVRRVEQIGTLAFDSGTGGNLVQDGDFRLRDTTDGTPIYWTPNYRPADPDNLGPGKTLTQALLPVSASEDVYVRLTMDQDWLAYTYDIGLGGANPDAWAAPAELSVYTVDEVGNRQYFPNWSSAPSGAGLAHDPTLDDPGVATYNVTRTSNNGIRSSGRLYVTVQGGETTRDDDTPTNAGVNSVRVELVDSAGGVIERYVVRVGDGQGEAVEIDPLPAMEVWDGSLWQNATEWQSAITGLTYQTLIETTAAERIAQQGRPLRAFALTLDGLIGPQFRLTVPGRDTVAYSPIATAVECVPVGLELDFSRGITRGVWVEAITDGGATEVLGKGERYTEAK